MEEESVLTTSNASCLGDPWLDRASVTVEELDQVSLTQLGISFSLGSSTLLTGC